MMPIDDRDAWTAYAERLGLLRSSEASSKPPARTKYGAIKTSCDGLTFDSRKEAEVYQNLKALEQAGAIAELQRQTAWPLHIMELWRSSVPIRITTVGLYRSDFEYLDLATGEYKVIDVKSEATRVKDNYRLKKKIVEAVHGITIEEV